MALWRRRETKTVAGAILHPPTDETFLDPETGAVTSRQGADIVLPAAALAGLWDSEHLERAARTYWSSPRRFSLGLMHVHYTESERSVVLLSPRLPLLTFRAPEYELDRCRGIVRWRIDRGLLVSRKGRDCNGYLELYIERHDYEDGDKVRLRVEVEVANYYPRLTGLSRRAYVNTQARIHVIACHFFLRRLVRRDLETSKVGHFAVPRSAEQTPDPASERETREDGPMPQPRRAKKRSEPEDFGWVISFGCKAAGELRRLKVDSDPAGDTRPVNVPCTCGEVHRVTVSPYRRRRSADEAFDIEVASLDELR